LAFAPDGQTLAIATGPEDFRLLQPGLVHLWEVATERVRAILHGHTRAVTAAVFSANGQTLITGSADTTVRFWDLNSGREYGMLKGHKAAPGFEALAVALAPDGSYLATASLDRTVKVWKTTRVQDDARSRVSVRALSDRTRPVW
jgi:WD40 repeat protein